MSDLNLWKRHIFIFRICLAIYLIYHFITLLPYAFEMFGQNQMLVSIDLNATAKIFPNILGLFNHSEILVYCFMVLQIVASIFLLFNKLVITSCIFLWYGWACLFNANNLILNPSLAYVGWLLLALAYVQHKKERATEHIYWGAGLLLALGYTISGVAKLRSPSWIDGSAILKIFYNPLARDYFLTNSLKFFPEWFFQLTTWGTLLLEVSYVFLFFFAFTRKLAWHAMVLLHLCILLFINFTDLTLGMLLIHLFTYDWDWHPRLRTMMEKKVNHVD